MTTATRTRKNNSEHRTLSDRLSRLEGRVSVMMAIDVGTFLAVLGLLLVRALG